MTLAEIKADVEKQVVTRPLELATHGVFAFADINWLLERVEELAEALREVEEWDSRAAARHGNLGVREFARDVRARLEGE